MKNNIGTDNQVFVREARKAIRASLADSGGIAALFSALSAVQEMILFWLGQIIPQTLKSMMIPIAPPMPIEAVPVLRTTGSEDSSQQMMPIAIMTISRKTITASNHPLLICRTQKNSTANTMRIIKSQTRKITKVPLPPAFTFLIFLASGATIYIAKYATPTSTVTAAPHLNHHK